MGRAFETDAIVLRSFRYAEADRIVHLLTSERGRVSALVRGARRTRSRLGGRLEPLSRTTVSLVEGRGELHTVTGADLVRGPDALLRAPGRLDVALFGAELVVRLFPEEEANARLFEGFDRFLIEAGTLAPADGGRAAESPLFLALALKLTVLAGFGLTFGACVHCGRRDGLERIDTHAGGAACAACPGVAVAPEAVVAARELLRSPLGTDVVVSSAARRDLLRVALTQLREHAGIELALP